MIQTVLETTHFGIIMYMAKTHTTEPPELTAAKKRYGKGVWEPRLLLGKPNNQGMCQILGIDHDAPKKWWPYKTWLLVNGEWMPSIEMPEKPERLSFIERARLKQREWETKSPSTE